VLGLPVSQSEGQHQQVCDYDNGFPIRLTVAAVLTDDEPVFARLECPDSGESLFGKLENLKIPNQL
jgi:hypothetical protein